VRNAIIGIVIGCYLAMFGAAMCLLFGGGTTGLIAAFVILHGAGWGVTSIVRPVITAEFLGRQGFGVISGMIALPFMQIPQRFGSMLCHFHKRIPGGLHVSPSLNNCVPNEAEPITTVV